MGTEDETEDGTAPPDTAPEESTDGDETVESPHDESDAEAGNDKPPTVELELHQLTVSASGRTDDELETVAYRARELMDYLIDHAERLDDQPDGRGLG